MKSQTVKSPAGETIEIVPDDDWMALTGANKHALRQWRPTRRPVVAALWTKGEFTDASGRASGKLLEAAWALGMEGGRVSGNPSGALGGVFNTPTFAPAVERKMNAKRTYAIRLVALPQTWYDKLVEEFPATNGHKAPDGATNGVKPNGVVEMVVSDDREAAETVATLVLPDDAPADDALPALPPDDSPDTDYGPPVDLSIASSVAMALLTQVVEIISTGTPDHGKIKRLETDLADVADKLARRLNENDSMRKQIRSLGEELVAVRFERDGLRKRLHAAETNLAKATNIDTQRIVNERVAAELAKVMRATPIGPKAHGKDDDA